jgi:hypothetical protein
VRATLEAHLSSREVSRVVYGSIIGLTLVVALDDHPPGALVMAAWLLLSGLTVGLAEVYSDVVGAETSQRHRITREQVRPMVDEAGAVAVGVALPAVFFVLAAMGWIELDRAFTLAKWSGLGLIGCYGYWAARLAGTPVGRALLYGLLVAAVGFAIIVVKALLH